MVNAVYLYSIFLCFKAQTAYSHTFTHCCRALEPTYNHQEQRAFQGRFTVQNRTWDPLSFLPLRYSSSMKKKS